MLHVAVGAAGEKARQSLRGGWGPRAALPVQAHPGKEAAIFSAKNTKVLMPFCTRRAGQFPQWGLLRLRPPACPRHSTCPGQQGASGSAELRDTFSPVPPPTSLFLGGKRECPWTARLQAIWPRQSLGVRSSWPWAEALLRSPVPTSRARLPGTSRY